MNLEKFLDTSVNNENQSIEDILEKKDSSPEDLRKGLMGFFNNIIESEHIDMKKYEDDRINDLIKKAEKI